MNWKTTLAVGAILLSGTFTLNALEPVEVAKLLPTGEAPGDFFGAQIFIDGDTAIFSSSSNDDAGENAGAAYVFVRSGDSWTEQAKLTAGDASPFAMFGWAVSVDADTAVVGAKYDNSTVGAVYVFGRTGTTWNELTKIDSDVPADRERFGSAVEIAGDTLFIGAERGTGIGSRTGVVYVYQGSGGSWTKQAELTASDGEPYDYFGTWISHSDDTLLIGARNDDANGSSSGSAYVFTFDGENWVEEDKLVPSGTAAGYYFGRRLSLSGDTALIGTLADAAYIFERSGSVWTETMKLQPDDGFVGDGFGSAVSISGDTALVSAIYDDDSGARSGSAYLYLRSGKDWNEVAKITPADGVPDQVFGNGTYLQGDTAAIVSNDYWELGPYPQIPANDIAAAYFFDINRGETAPGTDVVITPFPEDENGDPIEDAPQIDLAFDSVTAEGDTTVIITEDGPPPPGGFELIGTDGGSTYIDIETTAAFEDLVEICIDYSGFQLAVDPASLSLAHIVDGEWIDITVSNDLTNGVLCGVTPSFSYFAIVQVTDPFTLLAELKSAVGELDATVGTGVSLFAMLAKIERLMEGGSVVNAASDLMNKFILQVQKYSGNHISVSEAEDLVHRATVLSDVLLF